MIFELIIVENALRVLGVVVPAEQFAVIEEPFFQFLGSVKIHKGALDRVREDLVRLRDLEVVGVMGCQVVGDHAATVTEGESSETN